LHGEDDAREMLPMTMAADIVPTPDRIMGCKAVFVTVSSQSE
jgi:hypothetical protein